MRTLSAVLIASMLFTCACAGTQASASEDPPPIKWAEVPDLPKPEGSEVIPLPVPDSATQEERDALAALDLMTYGYAITESKLLAIAEFQTTAHEVHAAAVHNTQLGKLWTSVLWKDLGEAGNRIDALEAEKYSWWNQNSDTVLFVTGTFIGSALTILVVYGVDQAQE